MALYNQSSVTEFILYTFSENPQVLILTFMCLLGVFIMAFIGNSIIIIVIFLNPGLHTPMYFFLINLAVMDVLFISSVVPKFLRNIMTKNVISYGGCLTQIYFLTWCMGAELLLFTVMAYDRYAAICQPLHYNTLVNKSVCCFLVAAVWAISGINTTAHLIAIVRLSFCGPNVIDNLFCEIPPLMPLSCTSTYANNIMLAISDIFFAVISFLLIMVSYCFIISSILNIRTKEGKKKAFSTCSSHLIVVTMYYSAIIYIYFLPYFGKSRKETKIISVFYSMVSPALNPIIYSLRNKDVKVALRKLCPFLFK